MEILTNPEMARRVRAGRAAVASADVVELEELGGSAPVPGQCRVALTGPVAGQLAQLSEPSATEVRELLGEVARSPTDGRALGMGMVGVWSRARRTASAPLRHPAGAAARDRPEPRRSLSRAASPARATGRSSRQG